MCRARGAIRLYGRRQAIVEPVIKQARGIRGFSRRGKAAAHSEWKLICGTHNLLKLCRRALADPTSRPTAGSWPRPPPESLPGATRGRTKCRYKPDGLPRGVARRDAAGCVTWSAAIWHGHRVISTVSATPSDIHPTGSKVT